MWDLEKGLESEKFDSDLVCAECDSVGALDLDHTILCPECALKHFEDFCPCCDIKRASEKDDYHEDRT